MSTDSVSAELLDYLNNELPPERRAEIEQILRSDPERASELEGYRKAQKVFRNLRVNNVSGDFNEKVQQRIQAKIAELRAKGSTRFRTSRERVEAARDGLSAEEVRKRSRKAAKFSVLAVLLVALPLLMGILYWTGFFVETNRKKVSATAWKRLTQIQRRRKAERIGVRREKDGSVSGLGILQQGTVRLMTSQSQKPRYRCLFVYDQDHWQQFLKTGWNLRGSGRHAAWLEAMERAEKARLEAGRVALPEDMVGFLPVAEDLTALNMRDHIEIWVSSELEAYIKTGSAPPAATSNIPRKQPSRIRWVPE